MGQAFWVLSHGSDDQPARERGRHAGLLAEPGAFPSVASFAHVARLGALLPIAGTAERRMGRIPHDRFRFHAARICHFERARRAWAVVGARLGAKDGVYRSKGTTMNWRNTGIATAIAAGVLGAAAYAQPYLQQVHGPQGRMMGDSGPGYGMMQGDGSGPGMRGRYGMGPGMMGGYGGHHMGPGMMGGGYGMGPGMMGGPGGHGLGTIRSLNLSDAQRTQLSQIEGGLRKKNWDLMGQMQDEMAKLRDGWSAKKTDRTSILAANKRMFELRQQMLENRLDAQDKAEALLTPQQREQYDKLRIASSLGDDDY
jgi:Spy/CpxP family protein refolding chaperone